MATNASRVFALSKVFHERARLGIMTVLVTRGEEVDWSELLSLLGLTKGNLAVHAGNELANIMFAGPARPFDAASVHLLRKQGQVPPVRGAGSE